ncbi:hypothetical protein DM860_000446 [Cuscuta australis]|uniref:UVR domain-containing protein n=1 Tax=Cuscuta australis TaxID=267555 RepID=A0A328CWG9_9ASTE|nr:hypothetical protein DM860_000446 [Cuscuta australis]
MAAEEENAEMASLFEGMVLFDPCEMVLEEAPNTDVVGRLGGGSTTTAQPAEPTVHVPAAPNHTPPLDENLFSDLTLTIPPSQSLELEDTKSPPDPSSLSLVSRQNSTRKKRRAGLRIGYGRDRYSASDSVTSTSAPFENSNITIGQADDKEKNQAEREEEEEEGDDVVEEEEDQNMISGCDSSSGNVSQCVRSSDAPYQMAKLGGGGEDVTPEQLSGSRSHDPVELRFEQLRILISSKIKMANETVASISSEMKESIRNRRKAARNVTQAHAEYKELEKKLDEACEAEDFEKADRISESLAFAENEKEHLADALRDAEAQYNAVDSKMQEALDSLIQVEEECAAMLQSFAVDAELNLKTAEGLSSKQMGEWSLSVEAIEVNKMELEIEAEIVYEAQKLLKDSIEQFVEDDNRERDFLCRKKEVFTEELKQLLALVKEKEDEIAENDSLIEKVDNRIACAMSSFKEAQTNIEENYQNLQSSLSELMLANESLLEKKKEIDNYVSQEESMKAKIRDVSSISAKEANMFKEIVGSRKILAQSVLKSKEDKLRLSVTEDELAMHIQTLKQQISTMRTSLQELSSSKSRIQQEVDSSKQRLLYIVKKVPELETEKKVAATARNFKEAARLSTEAKALSIEKDGIETKLEGAESELKKVEEDICRTVERLQETEAQVSSKERELGMARFQRLILVDRACRAERSAALEFCDHEEADVLLEEAEAAVSEARKLQQIYGFKEEEEFTNLPKHFVSAELVSKMQGKQLVELAGSIC